MTSRRPGGSRAVRLGGAVAVAVLIVWPLLLFWRAALGEVALLPHDGYRYALPLKMLAARSLCAGTWPLWNPGAFGGYPLFAAMQPGVLFPPTWLFCVLPPILAANLQMILTCCIAALGTYFYARRIECGEFAALFAACSFAFGGFLVSHLGNMVTAQSAATLGWLLWGLESLRQGVRWRYLATAACALAVAIYAGYAPAVMLVLQVSVLYVLAFGLLLRPAVGRLRYLASATLALLLGLLLASAQLLPTAELGVQSVRARLSFAEFTAYSLPALQLPMLLLPFLFGGAADVPYWGAPNLWELSGYVGVLPLMLAGAATSRWGRNAHVLFWSAIAVWGLVLALGAGTPLASLMYHVPGYKLFRAQGRNLLQFDFALAVLAGLALSAASRRALSWGALVVTAVVLACAVGAVSVGPSVWRPLALASGGEGAIERMAISLSWSNSALWLPVATAVWGSIAVLAFARRQSLVACVALLALHLGDLAHFRAVLGTQDPDSEWLMSPPEVVQALQGIEKTVPPARVAVLRSDGEATDLRPLLWGVPLLNGFDPLLLDRYARFAGLDYSGALTPAAVLARPLVLDLMSARWIVLTRPAGDVQSTIRTFRGATESRFELAAPQSASSLSVTSFLAFAGDLSDGVPVARFWLDAVDAPSQAFELRAGDHTAEWCWEAANAVGSVRHRRAPVAEDFVSDMPGHWYEARLPLDDRLDVASVRVQTLLPARGELVLRSLALTDTVSGHEHVLDAEDALRGDGERWRQRNATGRTVVLENRRALPRAWLAQRTVALSQDDALEVVHSGFYADGTNFDPRRDALVASDLVRDYGEPDPDAIVVISAHAPQLIELATRSRRPAFLVVSEIDYPGWYAELDGSPVPIVRTDVVLRGVEVPAGEHRIRMHFAPRSLRVGLALSAFAAAALAVAGLMGRRCRRL